ncbi:MAG: hypothetical protein D6681_12400 [Calditrichaeota bacterium]|nr:MAG: hypothetical protein D6681_12400 [Calditrichota bacterium]
MFPYGFPDSLGGQPVFVRRDPNYPEKLMVVVGNPSLHNINYIVVGAMNAAGQAGRRGYPALDSLEIWLDELRVTGAERESGSAMRLATQLAMADVANIRAQWELIDDDFRRAEEQFAGAAGRNKTRQVQSYFASVKLDKFLPQFLGLEIPIDGSIKRSTEVPKYFFNSDQRTNYQLGSFSDRLQAFFGFKGIPEGLEQDATFSESKSIGGTLRRRGGKRDPWYLRLTLNQMVFDVDYSTRHAFNPNTEFNNSTNFRSRFNYSIPFGKKNFFHPFGWLGKSKLLRPITGIKFYYLPASASMTLSLTENTAHQKSRFEKVVPDPTINVRTNRRFAVKYRMFDNLTFDWSRDYQSDARLDSRGNKVDRRASDVLRSIFKRLDFGTDMQVNQRFSADYSPKLFSWLNTGYNYGANYAFSLTPSNLDRTSTLNVNQNVRLDLKLSTLVNSIYKPKPKRAVRPPSPRRPRGGKKPSEEEEGKKGDKKEGGEKKAGGPRFAPPNPLMMLWHFFNAFKSVSFNFRFEDSYRHSSLAGEPVWQYQFGFFRGPKVGQDTTLGKIARRPDIKNTRGIDGTLQLDIIRNVKSSFKYTVQRVSTRTHQNHTRSESSTIFFTGDDPDGERKPWWKLVPDWRISISGVEKFPLFKLIAKSATLEHARGGKFNKSARVENGEEFRNSATYSINYQPLLGLNISSIWGPTATVRATRTVSFDYRSAGGINKREQSGLSISISYSVSKGFKLPLPFFKKPLKNEISFSLTYDRTSTASFSKRSTEAEFEELEVNKSWKIRPAITYRFSQKVNGTAFYEQGSSTTKRTGTTNTKEFGINVNIAIR